MAFDHIVDDYLLYKERRKKLIDSINNEYKSDSGLIVLSANFEDHKEKFLQESSFFYFTGVSLPAVVMVLNIKTQAATLMIPAFKGARDQWIDGNISIDSDPASFGFDSIEQLGNAVAGYCMPPYVNIESYNNLIALLKSAEGFIFTLCPTDDSHYVSQRFLLSRLCTQVPVIISRLRDISSIVAHLRRTKDMTEIEFLQQAIEVTAMAHESAREAITDDINESEVQAALEYVITASQAMRSFPSIVGSGKNSVVLHYNRNSDVMHDGDLVVVDIGAQVEGYCADITRTYPVSGRFTKRQKDIYNIVLATQHYIAEIAAPGYWISNEKEPDKSLHHLAKKFLHEHGGYDKYFVHGIGHFLGLDVHDVGDAKEPLRIGDVITIEPGIYIKEENIGIRIEDNYWIVKGGAICLSEDIPKSVEDIEYAMSGDGESEDHFGHDHGDDDECGIEDIH